MDRHRHPCMSLATASRGTGRALLGSGRITWSASHWGGPKYHLWGRVPGGDVLGCTQDPPPLWSTVRARQLWVYRGAWADRSGTLTPMTCADGCGSPDATQVRWWSRCCTGRGVSIRSTDSPRSLPTSRIRGSPPRSGGYSTPSCHRPAGPTSWPPGRPTSRAALPEGTPLIEIVCDDDVGITGWSCLLGIGAVFADIGAPPCSPISRHRRPHRRRANSGAPTVGITSEVIDWPTVAGRRSPCHVRP